MEATFEAKGPHPIEDRQGKGFEFTYNDHKTHAIVTVFVRSDDPETAREVAVEAARAASLQFSNSNES